MNKVYVFYCEEYNGILNDVGCTVIGVSTTEEKAIELINDYSELHYANREVCPCKYCESTTDSDCEKCSKPNRHEDIWRKAEGDWTNGYLQCYDGEYDSWVKHYYLPFELDKLRKEEP